MNIEEKILDMRTGILKELKIEQPTLEKLISDNNYFVSKVAITLKEGNVDNYILVDFTSKQEDHIEDIEEYTFKIFKGFNEVKIKY